MAPLAPDIATTRESPRSKGDPNSTGQRNGPGQGEAQDYCYQAATPGVKGESRAERPPDHEPGIHRRPSFPRRRQESEAGNPRWRHRLNLTEQFPQYEAAGYRHARGQLFPAWGANIPVDRWRPLEGVPQ